MNMLKPGMYVRTDDGFIAGITKIDESFHYEDQDEIITKIEIDRNYKRNETNDYTTNYLYSNWLVDIKPRVVDLLQDGDFINGEMIISVLDGFVVTTNCAHSKDSLNDDNIKTFLTKEQYQKESYKPKRLIKTN